MPDITGKLQTILGPTGIQGSVEVMLCGYGSQIPRYTGVAMMAEVSNDGVVVAADGSFTFKVAANDLIKPDGSYYTVTVKNPNGDMVQVNAYRFTSDEPSYDLDTIPPYDPNQPPPPVPPLIINMLEIVAASDNMVFDGSKYTAFKTTLPGHVTQPVFQNMIPGNLYTFIIVQDGVGNHLFDWAANVKNPTPVNFRPGSTTVQTFVADDFENLIPISAGTYQ
jgi:hypothetical protein